MCSGIVGNFRPVGTSKFCAPNIFHFSQEKKGLSFYHFSYKEDRDVVFSYFPYKNTACHIVIVLLII